jgi:hypothetical protein
MLPRMCKGLILGIAYSRNMTGIDEERLQDDVTCRGSPACTMSRAIAVEMGRRWARYLAVAVIDTDGLYAQRVSGMHISSRRQNVKCRWMFAHRSRHTMTLASVWSAR